MLIYLLFICTCVLDVYLGNDLYIAAVINYALDFFPSQVTIKVPQKNS